MSREALSLGVPGVDPYAVGLTLPQASRISRRRFQSPRLPGGFSSQIFWGRSKVPESRISQPSHDAIYPSVDPDCDFL